MDDKTAKLLDYKKRYLNISYQITQQQLAGKDPDKKLIKQAHEIGRLAEIPDELISF